MKLVYLLRHAEASSDSNFLQDKKRPLTPKGVQQALNLADKMSAWQAGPQSVFSSSAVRTKQTTEHVISYYEDIQNNIVYDDKLYLASESQILETIQSIDDIFDRVMIVAHNPGVSDFANRFGLQINDMPTCGIAVIQYLVNKWTDIDESNSVILYYDYPKRLKI